jgi:hypothetical protein
MATHRLICLANSTKLGGHCVAGLRVDGKGWIRPVSELPEGELSTRQCTCASGVEVAPLDLIDIEVSRHIPLVNQSENWVVTNTPWTLVSRPAPATLAASVRKALVSVPPLLECNADRRSIHDFPSNRSAASLALVVPPHPTWQVTTSARNKMQVRCVFDLGSTSYNLVVTDPVWKQRFRTLTFGVHQGSAVGLGVADRLLLCISTGEPYRGYCYLLVAAVIVLDPTWRRALLK